MSRKRGTGAAVDRLMREALQVVLEGDGPAAEELLAKVVEKDSGAIDAYVALAHLLRERGEIERAIRIHQNLLLRPDLERGERIEALVEVGRDYARGGYPERALASFEEAIAEDDRHRGALRELLQLAEERGDFERSLWLTRRLAKLEGQRDPTAEARLWRRQGEVLLAEEKLREARKAARRALRLDPDDAAAQLLSGRVEQARGKSRAALAAFSKIPALDPALFARASAEIADAFAKEQDEEAYESLLREQLAAQQAPVLRSALIDSLLRRGATDEAGQEVARWLGEDPASPSAVIARAKLVLSAEQEAPTEVGQALGDLLRALESRQGSGA